MKIFDENNNIIENPDLTKGYLVEKHRDILHKYKITQEEQGHFETLKEYPNGGKDVQWIVDVNEEGIWVTYDAEGNRIETDAIVPDDAPHEIEISDIETFYNYVLYTEEELSEIEKTQSEPSEFDVLEAQVIYTAVMTDTLIEEV